MAKRFIDSEKWKSPRAYLEANCFLPDKWRVYKGIDIFRLEEKPGCYVIYSGGELVYIGQSNSLRFRIAQHLSKARCSGLETPWGNRDALLIKAKYPSIFGKEAMIEKRLIRKLKPRLNGYMKWLKRPYRQS